MAAALPQLAAQDHRGADLLVAGPYVLGAPEVDHGVPQAHALGVEEREAGALLVEAEEVEVAADAAVVALAGQLERLEVRRQLFLAREGGAVDAREHRVLLVAAPVGAGQAGELEGAAAELVGAGQVRAAAEVGELALRVDADGLLVGQVLDELDLEGLLGGAEDGEGLLAGQLLARELLVLGDDLRHLLLDAREVGLGDGLGELEVVVEAVLDGGADGVLGAREEAQDGLRHDVRSGVAQDVDGVGVVTLQGDDGDLVALVQRRGEVDEAAERRSACGVRRARPGGRDAARDGGFRQARADGGRRVAHGGAVGELEGGSVGEGDVQGHEVTGPFVLRARAPCGGCWPVECSKSCGVRSATTVSVTPHEPPCTIKQTEDRPARRERPVMSLRIEVDHERYSSAPTSMPRPWRQAPIRCRSRSRRAGSAARACRWSPGSRSEPSCHCSRQAAAAAAVSR